jgi:hypothetical protein
VRRQRKGGERDNNRGKRWMSTVNHSGAEVVEQSQNTDTHRPKPSHMHTEACAFHLPLPPCCAPSLPYRTHALLHRYQSSLDLGALLYALFRHLRS